MNTENVTVEYRPIRIGYCVRNGNIQDIVAAAKLNTLLWGGIFNPIIPIGSGVISDEAERLMEIFQVDILLPISETPEIKAFIGKYPWAKFPMLTHTDSIITSDSHRGGEKAVSVLDVSHLIRNLWNKDFKFAPDGYSNCAMVSWKANDPDKDLFTLLFGAYPKEKFAYPFHNNFKKALRAREIKIDPKKPIPLLAAKTVTPIALTEQEIKSYGSRGNGAGIYVGDPKNFTDLVNFWNIRASDSFLIFLPKKSNRRFLSLVRAHVAKIKKTRDYGDKKAVVSVWFTGEGEEAYKEAQEVVKPLFSKERIFSMVSASQWSHHVTPSYNVLREASCSAHVGTKYGKQTISVQLTDKPFKKRERRFPYQYFAVALRSTFGLDFPEHTINLPLLPDLNEWYSREMVFDPNALRVGKSYMGSNIAVLTEIDREVIDINPLSKNELVKKIFERAGIESKRSGAGLVAERLIALLGGVNGSARIFKITGVRKYILETDPLHQQTKKEIETKIDDGGSFQQKFAKEFGLRGRTPMTTEDVFQTMLEKDLIQPGVEARCPKCSLKNWIHLKEVRDIYECEYCKEKSKFVDTTEPITFKSEGIEKTIDGTRWYYRLSGLLGKSDKQQGAIPVILTLQHLMHRAHHTFGNGSILSTAMDLIYEKNGEKVRAETDLVVFDMDHRMGKQDFEVLLGECKTGKPISRAQIDSLVHVKELIEKSGVKCHLVFVRTKGSFSDAEIGHFKRLVQNGIKPLLFTSAELEKWWDEYKDFKKSRADFRLPVEHPFTFSDLAENSVYVYQLE